MLGDMRVQFEVEFNSHLRISLEPSNSAHTAFKIRLENIANEVKHRETDIARNAPELKQAMEAAENLDAGAGDDFVRLCAVNGEHKRTLATLRALGVVSVEVQREVTYAVLAPGVQAQVSFLPAGCRLVWFPEWSEVSAVGTTEQSTVVEERLVGDGYHYGIGVLKDKAEAQRRYKLAAAGGDVVAAAGMCCSTRRTQWRRRSKRLWLGCR